MSTTQPLQTVRRWHQVTPAVFAQEIAKQHQPAILSGLVKHWPAVQHALQSDHAVCHYLHALDSGKPVEAIMTPPQERGRIFYNSTQTGFNFLRNQAPLSKVMEQVLRYAQFDAPPAVAVQSALVSDCLPGRWSRFSSIRAGPGICLGGRSGAGECHLHPNPVVAPRALAQPLEYSAELLVAGRPCAATVCFSI